VCVCVQAYMFCSRVPDSRLTRGTDSAAKRCSFRLGGLTPAVDVLIAAEVQKISTFLPVFLAKVTFPNK